MGTFERQKAACLGGLDLSRKGSVDAPIQPLVEWINGRPDYFTTSSCSGRTIIVDNDDKGAIKKKGCQWLYTTHGQAEVQTVHDVLEHVEGNAVFKFEPFILHVQCRSLEDARLLLSCAVASGFRNSGISVCNKRKYITAVRSTQSLEVPLSHDGRLMVSTEYVEYIVNLADKKMQDNLNRIERFFKNVQDAIAKQEAVDEEAKHLTEMKKQNCAYKSGNKTAETTNETVIEEVDDFSDCCLFQSDFVT